VHHERDRDPPDEGREDREDERGDLGRDHDILEEIRR
jgi:hypothetical protein